MDLQSVAPIHMFLSWNLWNFKDHITTCLKLCFFSLQWLLCLCCWNYIKWHTKNAFTASTELLLLQQYHEVAISQLWWGLLTDEWLWSCVLKGYNMKCILYCIISSLFIIELGLKQVHNPWHKIMVKRCIIICHSDKSLITQDSATASNTSKKIMTHNNDTCHHRVVCIFCLWKGVVVTIQEKYTFLELIDQ